MKSIIASGLLLGMAQGAAIAGPYVNGESNSTWYGADALGTVIETHAGYEFPVGESASAYIQGGPAFVLPEGGDKEVELSGKAGIAYDVNENLEVYGEYAFITGDELGSNVKAGVTYRF